VSGPQLYVAILFAAAGAVFCALQLRRAIRATRDQDRANADVQAGLVLDDHAPGINTGWQDICELIYSLPSARRATSRNHRKEEDR
jgi:hypothetical protein